MPQVLTAPSMPNELLRVAPLFPSKVDSVVLAGAAKTVTVPVNSSGKPVASWVLLKVVGDTTYLAAAGAAAAPVADTMDGANDGSASWALDAFEGAQWYCVRGLASFSAFSNAAFLHIAWYREPGDAS